MAEKIILSACLAGVNCVYDGTNKRHPFFVNMFSAGEVRLVCPEMLAGLEIPHSPSEISGGDGYAVLEGRAKVLSREGRDMTASFLKGARAALRLARKYKLKLAVLKSKSPSCGCGGIFDGTFSGRLVPGFGVSAALLKQDGVEVIPDVEYLKSQCPNVPRSQGRKVTRFERITNHEELNTLT